MKALMAMVCVGVVAMCCGCGARTEGKAEAISASDRALKEPVTLELPDIVPSGDAGADIVGAFYKMLLQNEPVTLEQEKALLVPDPVLRRRLILGGLGKETEPVLLNFVRERKELLLPRKLRHLNQLAISSTFVFKRELANLKDKQELENGCVLVSLVEDMSEVPATQRTIVFRLENGKVDIASIQPNGFGGGILLDEFLKVKLDLDDETADTWPGSGHGDH